MVRDQRNVANPGKTLERWTKEQNSYLMRVVDSLLDSLLDIPFMILLILVTLSPPITTIMLLNTGHCSTVLLCFTLISCCVCFPVFYDTLTCGLPSTYQKIKSTLGWYDAFSEAWEGTDCGEHYGNKSMQGLRTILIDTLRVDFCLHFMPRFRI